MRNERGNEVEGEGRHFCRPSGCLSLLRRHRLAVQQVVGADALVGFDQRVIALGQARLLEGDGHVVAAVVVAVPGDADLDLT